MSFSEQTLSDKTIIAYNHCKQCDKRYLGVDRLNKSERGPPIIPTTAIPTTAIPTAIIPTAAIPTTAV
jgi:hypothetical protein